MVDVGAKSTTARHAEAKAHLWCSADALEQLRSGRLAKGDGLAVARVAGIMAAKRTADLIPLCHPLALDQVEVELELTDGVDITARVASRGVTGVEMEALTAAAVAGLTVIDMIKAIDRGARLDQLRVTAKAGGASGGWRDGQSGGLPAAGVITVSDRVYAGTRPDRSGPVAVAALARAGGSVHSQIVPDDIEAIRASVDQLIAAGCAIIITSGGTGVGPRDVTPEALAGLISQPVPGLAEAIRAAGVAQLASAALGRGPAGLIERAGRRTLIVALPGAPGAVADAMAFLTPLLPHVMAQLAGGDHDPQASPPTPPQSASPQFASPAGDTPDARLAGLTISADPIDPALVEAAVRRSAAGAVVGFTGVVRDRDDGQAVLALEYEAHPSAPERLRQVTEAWLTDHPAVVAVAVSHRLGRVDLGQTALAVAVAAPHRQSAFTACADLVDRIKAEVPLWKRQYFADGTDRWSGL